MGLFPRVRAGVSGVFGALIDNFEHDRRQGVGQLGSDHGFNRVGHARFEEKNPIRCQAVRFLVFYQSVPIIRP